jgi:hypothetical protein
LRRRLVLLFVIASIAAIAVPASPAGHNPAAAYGMQAICVAGGGSFTRLGLVSYCTTAEVSGFAGWSNLCVTQVGTGTFSARLTVDGYICDNTTGG